MTTTATYTHVGYREHTGHVHSGRLYGHRDYAGRTHALTGGPATPYEGATYRALCGASVVCGDEFGRGLTVWADAPEAMAARVTCRRCRKIMAG